MFAEAPFGCEGPVFDDPVDVAPVVDEPVLGAVEAELVVVVCGVVDVVVVGGDEVFDELELVVGVVVGVV